MKKEKSKKEKITCPTCESENLKRLTAGVWSCMDCGTEFTGKAFENQNG